MKKMKNLNSIILFIIFSIFFSCANNEITPIEDVKTQSIENNEITNLLVESGLQALKLDLKKGNTDLTWNDFHQNYLKSVEKYRNHEKWNTYASSLIVFQMKETSILENINADNYTILEMYLEELKSLRNAYPKFHYQMLSTLKPFMAKEKIASYAMGSYEKGVVQKENEKNRSEEIQEGSAGYDLVKEMLKKNYEENYIIYLPKLKEFFKAE